MPEMPHILLLLTDDQRFDTLRALGNGAISTPNMDRLVARGTAFTHAHIPCGTSGAVCMPSRAMLHTGRTLFHLQGAGEAIPPEHTTLGECLRAAGYRTFGTGKWHNGRESYHRSFTDGAEVFFGGMADHWNVPAYRFDPSGRYDATCPIVDNPMASNEVRLRHCDHIEAGKHSSELLADAAVRFVRGYDSAAPLFAYVSFLAPHDPRTMPGQYLEMYDPADIELPPNYMEAHPFDNGDLRIRDEMLARFPRTPGEIRRHIAEYYAMISHVDAQIGRIIEAFEGKGLLQDTVIVFAGDNGLALGQHGLMGKQSCYEHSVRVPLAFAGPGVPVGVRSPARAYLLDVFPTLCELIGTPRPDTVEGESLVKAMRDPSEKVRDSLYMAYVGKHRAVADDSHKLIEYVVDGRHCMTQLFDLQSDPWELRNLAADPTYAGKVSQLRAEMVRYRDEWDDRRTEWGQAFWGSCEF